MAGEPITWPMLLRCKIFDTHVPTPQMQSWPREHGHQAARFEWFNTVKLGLIVLSQHHAIYTPLCAMTYRASIQAS